MAKYTLKSWVDVKNLFEAPTTLVVGDIIVHKPLAYATIQGYIKQYFGEVELVPATIGTEVYTINGYNTSVIKAIPIP